MFESVIRVHISVIYLHLLYDKLSIFCRVKKLINEIQKIKVIKLWLKKLLIISSSPPKGR